MEAPLVNGDRHVTRYRTPCAVNRVQLLSLAYLAVYMAPWRFNTHSEQWNCGLVCQPMQRKINMKLKAGMKIGEKNMRSRGDGMDVHIAVYQL